MPSKSRNKIVDGMLEQSPQEIFRALYKSSMQKNDDLTNEIIKKTPKLKRKEIKEYILLLNQKSSLYTQYIMVKATIAVRFYNFVMFSYLGLGKVEEGGLNFQSDFEVQESLLNQIQAIDKKTNGALNIEEFRLYDELDIICSQWIKVVIKIVTGYSVKTPVEDFEEYKSALEQLLKTGYNEER